MDHDLRLIEDFLPVGGNQQGSLAGEERPEGAHAHPPNDQLRTPLLPRVSVPSSSAAHSHAWEGSRRPKGPDGTIPAAWPASPDGERLCARTATESR